MLPHELVLSPSVQNALGMIAWSKFAGDPDPAAMVKELRQQVRELQGGNLGRVEAMLYGQAVTLGTIVSGELIACAEGSGAVPCNAGSAG
jgi:hypothetical protein